MTYAASVTRKMLHFNDLKFYTIPTLPEGWTPPTWLSIGLGIFAGRLYFDYREYGELQKFLGIQQKQANDMDTSDGAPSSGELNNESAISESPQRTKTFTARPLTFLQEWLTITRKGQDFNHTPMGFVCHGKALFLSHPFFQDLKSREVLETATKDTSTSHDAGDTAGQGDSPSASEDGDSCDGVSGAEDNDDLVEHGENQD